MKLELLDPAKRELRNRNLQDIARINRRCGGQRDCCAFGVILRARGTSSRYWIWTPPPEIMRECIRKAFPNAKVLLTDYRLAHLRSAALPRLAADAFRLPFHPGTFDFVVCSSVLHHFPDNEVVDLIRQIRFLARRALIILERHAIPYYFRPITRRVFGWSTLTLHDGPISVAAGFRSEELASLTHAAGASAVTIRKHRPWFRLSAVVPAIPSPGHVTVP